MAGRHAPAILSAFYPASHIHYPGQLGGCAQCNVRLTMPQMISTLRAAGWRNCSCTNMGQQPLYRGNGGNRKTRICSVCDNWNCTGEILSAFCRSI